MCGAEYDAVESAKEIMEGVVEGRRIIMEEATDKYRAHMQAFTQEQQDQMRQAMAEVSASSIYIGIGASLMALAHVLPGCESFDQLNDRLHEVIHATALMSMMMGGGTAASFDMGGVQVQVMTPEQFQAFMQNMQAEQAPMTDEEREQQRQSGTGPLRRQEFKQNPEAN